ncbi:MvdC/MvdD family ATP grasp protein [Streptomyces sp. NPDC000927]|uniref:MvdC/MvdD family ATP grasp protein n=1 Tax=Streptomyces sp. NPDC000927 TaxID=3154371 RepID=UPI00333409F6
MTVLILTRERDAIADMLARMLGDKVACLDLGDLPAQIKLTATWHGGTITGAITSGARRVRLQEVKSVWMRKPSILEFPAGAREDWITRESVHAFIGALRALPGVRWMSHPDAQEKARYKLHQLAVAHEAGLASPSTLVTTDSDGALAYLDGTHAMACKTLSGHHSDFPASGIISAPTTGMGGPQKFSTCFQRAVERATAVRLVAVGGQIFCARSIDRSWRQARVPTGTATKIMKVMKSFGLSYAAFDFAEDVGGRWWFQGIDPSGSFSALEREAGLPISQAIAEWLLDK